ncbi:MAG TPA: ATP-binding protein [Terriglobales bacterium]|nr:ATP-binding protein [Terriglobales bacterium]
MTRKSIRRRLVTTVVLSQALLALGLLLAGVLYTRKRLLSALDSRMQAHATSLAALARYTEDPPEKLYFDKTLANATLDPDLDDAYAIWADQSGLLTRSDNWPKGLEVSRVGNSPWTFDWKGVPYRGLRLSEIPVLDREPDTQAPLENLSIVYASPLFPLQRQVQEAGIFIAGMSLLLLSITTWFALWGIRQGLLPLQQLAENAALVSTHNWQLQVPKDANQVAELQPVVQSMQTMLLRLERSFAQQKEFLGNAAHELKTPVAVLKSTLQSLLQRPRASEDYQRGLENSLEDLERLERLLQWMLRLARAEQWAHGALRLDLQVIDVTATCEEAVERVRHLAQERKVDIHLTKDGQVPLRVDPEDLQLVWANLLENAVRYSPEGRSVEVEIQHHDGGPVRITFQDHGPSIPADDLPHIFQRFYRGDASRARSTGGFGLGLAIAKALVEAYGGSIQAESEPGQGTRMTVELPITSDN